MVSAGALAAFAVTIGIVPASAQVRVAVQVNTVPVSGTVVIGAAPRPAVHAVVVYAATRRAVAPSVLVVERVPHRGRGWWRRHGYRRSIVYTDGRYYFSGWMSRPGVRQVTVYARDGRYAMETDGRHDRREWDD